MTRMEVIPIQQCRSLNGWVPKQVQSTSDLKLRYLVLCNPWGKVADHICECLGFLSHGYCKHQLFADAKICRWRQPPYGVDSVVRHHGFFLEQTVQERKNMNCPKCGEKTMWTMVADEN